MRSIRRFICFVLTVLSGVAIRAQSDFQLVLKVPNAVAVAGSPNDTYYVLTGDNAVFRYVQSGSGLQFSGRFPLVIPGDGVDLALVRAEGQDSVVITQSIDQESRGLLRRYSEEGKVISTWVTPHLPTGIAFDPGQARIYFVTLDSNELYSVDINGGQPHIVCEVRGALRLGPLTLDVKRQRAYTADSTGTVFVVDLPSKKVTRLSASFALASALLLDGQGGILYVADLVQKRIYGVDLSKPGGHIVAQSAQLTSPSGLAPGSDNALIITDNRSGSVYLGKVGSPVIGTTKKTKSN